MSKRNSLNANLSGRSRQGGTTLIVVLIMLVVIGLSAASSMRNATSGERIVNNLRLESSALQYAEMALRHCEAQMALPSASRPAGLDDGSIPSNPVASALWSQTSTWLSGTVNSLYNLNSNVYSNAVDGTDAPTQPPQCLVERVTYGSGSTTLVITARGFSTGYSADSTNGTTQSGSVVWLQSTSGS